MLDFALNSFNFCAFVKRELFSRVCQLNTLSGKNMSGESDENFEGVTKFSPDEFSPDILSPDQNFVVITLLKQMIITK